METINLLCFPFAGGNKYSYSKFKDVADKRINIITCELPGRGERYYEGLITAMNEMVDDLFAQIKDKIKEPYAIYGHSMGCLLGYLVTKAIISNGLPRPLHLFFSGSCSPAFRPGRSAYHRLPKDRFIHKIKSLGGVEEEVLKHTDIIDMYEPILRADFQAVETYVSPSLSIIDAVIDIDISVLIGKQDKVTVLEAMAWQLETTGKVSVTQFSGGHFFIFHHEKEILKIIEDKLKFHRR